MAGIDPQKGQAPAGIEAQTDQAMTNLAAVLREAGASRDDLVKITISCADADDFGKLNEVYALSARSTARPDCDVRGEVRVTD